MPVFKLCEFIDIVVVEQQHLCKSLAVTSVEVSARNAKEQEMIKGCAKGGAENKLVFRPQVTGTSVEASTGSPSLSDRKWCRELKSTVRSSTQRISATASC